MTNISTETYQLWIIEKGYILLGLRTKSGQSKCESQFVSVREKNNNTVKLSAHAMNDCKLIQSHLHKRTCDLQKKKKVVCSLKERIANFLHGLSCVAPITRNSFDTSTCLSLKVWQ